MKPAPCIGLRIGRRVSGEPYLHGISSEEFTIPKGARVQLRRLRPDGDGDTPTHAIVFAPPDPNVTPRELDQAGRDAAWHRRDARDSTGDVPW